MKRINWPDQILNFIGVILGVLLAFYISDIAESNKEKREIREFLHSFINELDADIQAYEVSSIPKNEEQSSILSKVIANIQNPNKSEDQAALNFDVFNHAPHESSYNSLISSGKLGLIREIYLRKEIMNYYSSLGTLAKARNEAQADFLFQKLMPWWISNSNKMSFSDEEANGNRELINLLSLYKQLIDSKIRAYRDITVSAKGLKENIHTYLAEN